MSQSDQRRYPSRARHYCKLAGMAITVLVLLVIQPVGVHAQAIEVAAWRFPPYAYVDGSGELRGQAVETVEKVLVAMGYKPRMVLLPFKRCLRSMQEGDMPIMLPCAVSEEWAEYMQYTNPVYHITTVLWKKGRDMSGC